MHLIVWCRFRGANDRSVILPTKVVVCSGDSLRKTVRVPVRQRVSFVGIFDTPFDRLFDRWPKRLHHGSVACMHEMLVHLPNTSKVTWHLFSCSVTSSAKMELVSPMYLCTDCPSSHHNSKGIASAPSSRLVKLPMTKACQRPDPPHEINECSRYNARAHTRTHGRLQGPEPTNPTPAASAPRIPVSHRPTTHL